jgi:hypothetical protein
LEERPSDALEWGHLGLGKRNWGIREVVVYQWVCPFGARCFVTVPSEEEENRPYFRKALWDEKTTNANSTHGFRVYHLSGSK